MTNPPAQVLPRKPKADPPPTQWRINLNPPSNHWCVRCLPEKVDVPRDKALVATAVIRQREQKMNVQVKWLFTLCQSCANELRSSTFRLERERWVAAYEGEMHERLDTIASRKQRPKKLTNTPQHREIVVQDLLDILRSTE